MVNRLERRREWGGFVSTGSPNGAAAAAFLAAGIGAFAMGLIAFLYAVDLLPLPVLYEPAGGVSSRTTLALAIWLIAWGFLHFRWRAREIDISRTGWIVGGLIALGVAGTFPPLWNAF
jgi:hypothetical protein